MKASKRTLSLVLALVLALTAAFACFSGFAATSSVALTVGGQQSIFVGYGLTLKSMNTGIATVYPSNTGYYTVFGVSAGTTYLVSSGGSMYTVTVSASGTNPGTPNGSGTMALAVGATETIAASTGSYITSATSSNSSVASVYAAYGSSYATVTGLSVGTATISIYQGTSTTPYTLTVYVTATGSGSTASSIPLTVGQSATYQSNGYFASISIANTSIANVSFTPYGTTATFTGLAAGSTYAYITEVINGAQQNRTVPIVVTGGTNAGGSSTTALTVGGRATVYPTTGATLLGASSANPNVATVTYTSTSAVITGISAGTTTVTLNQYYNGSYNTVTVTVYVTGSSSSGNSGSTAGGINFKSSAVSVTKGKRYSLKGMTVNGSTVSASDLLWVSADEDIITVDANTGKFKAVGRGSTLLIAVTKDAKNIGSITVNVK